MTFTISQTFDFLFAAPAAPTGRPGFEERRWFRRPAPVSASDTGVRGAGTSDDVSMADDQLSIRIKRSLHEWSAPLVGITPRAFDPARHLPPRSPYDVFAAAAHLVEQAGIYHHIQPAKTHGTPRGPAAAASEPRHLSITQRDRNEVDAAASRWRALSTTGSMIDLSIEIVNDAWIDLEPLFESWWIVFCAAADEAVVAPNGDEATAIPFWWRHAWRLMAIADEAAAGTVYQLDAQRMADFVKGTSDDLVWFEFEAFLEQIQLTLGSLAVVPTGDGAAAPEGVVGLRGELGDIHSLSVANRGIVSVLPKVRTPSVGCTLRSLSHHLALLPPRGVVKGRWTPNYTRPSAPAGGMPGGVMNLVLVPLPYSLGPRSFESALIEDVSHSEGEKPRFGYFDVNQHWITEPSEEQLIEFVDAVISTARAQSAEIHGLVFPELSLDYATFMRIREHLRSNLPSAEVLIGGVSSNADGRSGNFVAVSTFPDRSGSTTDETRDTLREKHHRWKLDRSQLRDYGLLGKLSPELSWWENIALHSRQVDFTVMRRDSVVAAMICEDLARVDPCQQVIRAVGPNLVVALLMDAPQVEARWPARYATVLAEDPGCAVLTLTSRGLMTLQHRLGTFKSNGDDRVVAMWRDDGATAPIRLTCPYDAQALLLTIVEEPVCDVALDGRKDGDAIAWRYVGSVPLRLPDAKKAHGTVLGPEDMACW